MSKKKVIICGGGIIGASTAHYLSVLDTSKTLDITVVERNSIACHSSGKAGGFLALDWHTSHTEALAELSYRLHEELANNFSADIIGYRKLHTYSVTSLENRSANASIVSNRNRKNGDFWVDRESIRKKETIGTQATTAQVHPFILTNELMKSAINNGAKLKIGVVIGVDEDENHKISHVNLDDGSHLDADIVVIAMGAWASRAADLFPLCKNAFQVTGSRAHSIVLEANVPPEAIFVHHVDQHGKFHEPEIYPRPDGTVYVCGNGDDAILPEDPASIIPNPEACENLQNMTRSLSSHLRDAKLLKDQACFLPCSPDGIPIIGKLPFYTEAYVGTGHSFWGILNGPATGKCLAQAILGKEPDVDLTEFSPERFLDS